MHANQPYPVKLHQALTKAGYEMDEVENRSWLIDLKATALYILLQSRDCDLGNYRPTRTYIWNNRHSAQPMSFLMKRS